MNEETALLRVVARRALAAGNPANLPLHFEIAVLDRYRDAAGYSLIRSDTVARLRKEGGWSIDFGIAPGEELIHLSIGDLEHLPEEERDHWAAHVTALPASRTFLQMRISGSGACIDDGEVRPW
jgi:hypothetical protein